MANAHTHSPTGIAGTDRLRFAPLLILATLSLIAMLLPAEALRPLDLVGYAVCHRIPARSFFVAGNQLPVCARDTGMFSAALIGLVCFAAVLRTRAAHFPRLPFVFVFVACFAAWAFDGLNSYFLLATDRTLLYEPQNWLRLTTGALMGASLSAFVAPFFNSAVWRAAADQPSVATWRDVTMLALVAGAVIVVVLWRPDFLYGPIALISALGVLTLLTIVNGLLVLILAKRHGQIEHWSQLTVPAVVGLILSLAQIALIDLGRAALTQSLGLPF
jgi:uncharacterized membrane protein